MPLYKVAISRIFIVKIEAQSEQEAAGLAPFYLGSHDSSEALEREEFKFEFKEIDMVENELIAVDRAEN